MYQIKDFFRTLAELVRDEPVVITAVVVAAVLAGAFFL